MIFLSWVWLMLACYHALYSVSSGSCPVPKKGKNQTRGASFGFTIGTLNTTNSLHNDHVKASGWAPLSCKQASRVKVKLVDPVQESKQCLRLWRRLLLVVQNPKAGRCQGTCLLITASLSEHVFLCLSDICSRCFNNVILEKEDNRTVG